MVHIVNTINYYLKIVHKKRSNCLNCSVHSHTHSTSSEFQLAPRAPGQSTIVDFQMAATARQPYSVVSAGNSLQEGHLAVTAIWQQYYCRAIVSYHCQMATKVAIWQCQLTIALLVVPQCKNLKLCSIHTVLQWIVLLVVPRCFFKTVTYVIMNSIYRVISIDIQNTALHDALEIRQCYIYRNRPHSVRYADMLRI